MLLCTLAVFGFINLSFSQINMNTERISVKIYDEEGKQIERFQLKGEKALSFDIPKYILDNNQEGRLKINGAMRTALSTTIIKFDSDQTSNEEGDYICQDVELKQTPFLGVWGTGRADHNGIDIKEVVPATAAARAYITSDEIITGFDGIVLANFCDLQTAVLGSEIGRKVELNLRKSNSEYSKDVVIGSRDIKTITYKYCEEDPFEMVEENNQDLLSQEATLNAFPNPTGSLSHVQFQSTSKEDVIFIVTDIKGSVIHKEIYPNFTGNLNLDYNLAQEIDGTYILTIQQGSAIYNRKVQLIKE